MSFLSKLLPSEINSSNAISPGAAKTLTWGVGLLAAAVLAPLIWAAVSGIVGLIVGASVLWASLKFAPVFGRLVSNGVLKAIKWEARRNPIETYERQYKEQQEQIQEDETLAGQFTTMVERFRNEVEEIRRASPEDYPSFKAQLDDRIETQRLISEGIRAAKVEQQEFYKLIERLKIIWRATQSDAAIGKFSERLSRTDAIKRIEQDEALSAIKDRMAQSRANLTMLRQRMTDASALRQAGAANRTPQVAHAPSPTLPASTSTPQPLVQVKDNVYTSAP